MTLPGSLSHVEDARGGFEAQLAAARLVDPTVKVRTIGVAGQVVGSIGQFTRSGLPEVSYELGPQ
jgi:hypothetical protein